MSSTFLWKGCCVGVVADTETVDELYIDVSTRKGCDNELGVAYHDEARRRASLSRRPSVDDTSCPTGGRVCWRPRKNCCVKEGRMIASSGCGRERLSLRAWRD